MVRDFGTDEAAAIRFAKAIDRRRGLPRCDHPKWGDPEVVVFGDPPADCGCTDRTDPLAECRHATHTHVGVDTVGASYVVRVTREVLALKGTQVSVDGVRLTITDTGARELTEREASARTPHWRGAR